MTGTLTAAFICYLVVTLLLVIFGATYLTRSKFMPYHQQALDLSWSDLDARMQTLLLALMRVSGGGFLAAALAIIIMLFVPFRAGEAWAKYAIPAVGLTSALPSLYATVLVRTRTSASSPVGVSVLGVVLLVLGFVLSLL
jgi:hypothetical protein